MSEPDINAIRRIDGSILLVLRELLTCHNASEAARRLNLSQSAVSHALRRLREVFGDPLFIRRAHGLEPTPRALELAPRVDEILDLVSGTLRGETQFDATRSNRQFVASAPEFFWAQFGGPLLRRLAEEAPGVSLVMQSRHTDPRDDVRSGALDLAIGRFGESGPGVEVRLLYEDDYCVVARRGHPAIRGGITLDQYCSIGNLFSGTRGREGPWERIPDASDVKTLGFTSDWVVALHLVASSNGITSCPRRFAESCAPRLRLQVLEPPWRAAPFRIEMAVRPERRPDVDWIIDRVHASCA